jgi:hypothetical protein
MQGAYFRSHTRSTNQHVKISQRLPIDVLNHLFYFSHAQCRIQKARGYRSTNLSAFIIFSMCITVYKKQGAP